MKIDPTDPKLTAYALGELDEKERAAVEAALDDQARAEADKIRATAQLLKQELANEPCPALDKSQREKIESAAMSPANKIIPFRSKKFRWTVGLAAAAAIALMVGLPMLQSSRETERRASAVTNLKQIGLASHLNSHDDVENLKSVEVWQFNTVKPETENATETQLAQTISTVNATVTSNNTPPTTPLSRTSISGTGKGIPGAYVGRIGAGRRGLLLKKGGQAVAIGQNQPVIQPGNPQPNPQLGPGGEKEFNTEAYDRIVDNPFLAATENPLSTFSIDVDTASYSNVRRFLTSGQRPPPDSVRIEELVNYFPYRYEPPKGDNPFAAHVEVASCPWAAEHRLVRIGLKGKEIAKEKRPMSNLVFLLDVSGSMQDYAKLPLVKQSMRLLVQELTENDRVAVVVYAGNEGLALPPTTGDQKEKILAAIDQFEAGGSTNGGAGIMLAYKIATENFIKGGTNRVVLCTDGDFNVGVTNQGDLTRLIEEKAKSGVFLSVLGFGMGNLKDSTMEKLSDKGNGNYAYIDTLQEGRKVLVEQMTGTLITIAKDVKIQIEFNPAQVASYRLIGYENRLLAKEDFNDDKKDAGEIGAGHTVTALYEVVPVAALADRGKEATGGTIPSVDPLKYQTPAQPNAAAKRGELLTLKLRYKAPDGDTSKLLEFPVTDKGAKFSDSSSDFRFASAVAAFGMILRDSPHKGNATFAAVAEIAEESKGDDKSGYRREFIGLAQRAKEIVK